MSLKNRGVAVHHGGVAGCFKGVEPQIYPCISIILRSQHMWNQWHWYSANSQYWRAVAGFR